MRHYKDKVAIETGMTLKEQAESLGITDEEMAIKTGWHIEKVRSLWNGGLLIDAYRAKILSDILDLPPYLILNLERQYRINLEEIFFARELDCLSYIPMRELIKGELESQGIKQCEFAKMCNISEKHLSNVLRAKSRLTYELAYKFEEVLGVSAKTLVSLDYENFEKTFDNKK